MAVSTQISDKCLSIRLIVVDPDVNEGLSYLDAMAIAILVIGSVLVVIGFLGCCGAMKQVKLFLTCVRTTANVFSLLLMNIFDV